MSKGPAILTKYQDQHAAAKYHSILVQKETPGLSIGDAKNTAPTEDATEKGRMTVSKTSRRHGKRPMTGTFKWKSTAPDGYSTNGRITLPLLNNTIQKAATAATKGITEGTYMEQTVIFMSYRDQDLD